MKRDFLMVRDFTTEEIHEAFEIARDMKADRKKYSKVLEGETLALIFEKPSLRTRTTFDVGIQQLGGYSLYLSPAEINLGKRESVYDVAKNLERMVQGIMIRTFGHDIVENMSKYAKIPIINGLTDYSHPCQAMADFLTILEVKGKLEGLKLTYVGDGNNVAHSLMDAGARLGVNVTISCPRGYEPNMIAYQQAVEDAKQTGAKIEVVHDPFEAVKGADAVYTDVWASMGQESEAAERRRIFLPYQVNENLMAAAKSDAMFLHCLPAHRGDEVTDGVIDAPYSFVFQEAENRLHAQKSVMYKLMKQA
ncbi:MAG: ornithine carbamoyltransferase [Candidatus Kapaibacterium sp.]|jgi:ornithine carbamoyltransferase|nr:ornithine carbamoyltransferase [Candidatus Kapabacteria bacterium]